MPKCWVVILITLFSFDFVSLSQTSDTTKYLEVEVFVTVWNGDTAVSAAYVQEELDHLNTSFYINNTGIQFVLCGGIQFIQDVSGSLAFGSGSAPYGNYEKRGAIHIWNVNSIPGLPGIATPSQARIRLSGYYALGSIVHEMGHILSLGHTHDGSGSELVDGSNCTIAGDLICDTPADPGLSGSNVNASCVYIGTATDANGDPYNPLTNNFMSYAPGHCQNAFTQGQVDRMNNYLNTSGFFINRVDSVRDITTIPSTYCSNDLGSYGFTLLTDGSSVTGPGIVGNSFYPSLAGVGVHEIVTSYPTDSLIYNDFVVASVSSTIASMDAWNSYAVDNGGKLKTVYGKMYVTSTTNITMEVRSGSGIAGTLLHSQVITLNPAAGLQWVEVPITANVNLTTGQTYTIRFHAPSSFNIGADYHVYPTTNSNSPFPSFPPSKNLYAMVVQLKGLESCGNTGYRYAQVFAPITGSINELKSDYCNTISHAIELIGNPSNGTFYIDGVQDSVLNPQNLTIGNHVLEFISTDINGCTGLITHPFTVSDLTAIVSPSLDSSYCLNAPIVELIGSPAGGVMTIDGTATTSLNPSLLGPGLHTVQYVYSSAFDTLTIQGPINLWESATYFLLIQDSTYWQSFISDSSGYLNKIRLGGGGANILPGTTFVTSVYKGVPSLNDLLYTDTTDVNTLSTINAIIDSVSGVFIYADTAYSFSFEWIVPSGPPPGSAPLIPYTSSDAYIQGVSSLDGVGAPSKDFGFSIELDQHHVCDDVFMDEFYIESCFVGLDDANNADIRMNPNPASDHIVVEADPDAVVEIYSITGARVASGVTYKLMDVSDLKAGMYHVVITENDRRVTLKLVIL